MRPSSGFSWDINLESHWAHPVHELLASSGYHCVKAKQGAYDIGLINCFPSIQNWLLPHCGGGVGDG